MLALIILLSLIPIAVVRGFVLTVLWAWFVTEPFGVHQISIPEGLGIALIVGMLIYGSNDSATDRDHMESFISAAVAPIIMLAFGWIFHQFM